MQEAGRLCSLLGYFKPPGKLSKVNILLVGGVGAGKSSLISSIDSIFKQRISCRAPHGQATASFTRQLTRYSFKLNAQMYEELSKGKISQGRLGLCWFDSVNTAHSKHCRSMHGHARLLLGRVHL